MASKPARSSRGASSAIIGVVMRVAQRHWCASRKVTSISWMVRPGIAARPSAIEIRRGWPLLVATVAAALGVFFCAHYPGPRSVLQDVLFRFFIARRARAPAQAQPPTDEQPLAPESASAEGQNDPAL